MGRRTVPGRGISMIKRRKWCRIGLQFIKFGMVGVVNNMISLAVYYLVVFFSPKLYLLGNILGFLVSTLNAYTMNSRIVFRSGEEKVGGRNALWRTYAVYMFSLGISTGILYITVSVLHLGERIAPIFSLMVTVPFNFLMNKFWIYRKRSE